MVEELLVGKLAEYFERILNLKKKILELEKEIRDLEKENAKLKKKYENEWAQAEDYAQRLYEAEKELRELKTGEYTYFPY